MTHEDKFISEIEDAKIFGFPFTKETFRKQFFKQDSLLGNIIYNSILKGINFVPAFSLLLDEASQGIFSINNKSIQILCNNLAQYQDEKLVELDDAFIENLCLLQCKHKDAKAEHVQAQLVLCKMIKDPVRKIETTIKIYENLLAVDNSSKNQKLILKDWKKLKQNSEDIAHMIPLLVSTKPAICHTVQEINVIEINCNSIAETFSTKSIHSCRAISKIIGKFKNQFPQSMMALTEKEDYDGFTIFMTNMQYAEKLNLCINYFTQKIASEKVWSDNKAMEQIVDNNWDSIMLADKLDNNLSNDKKTGKNIKI